jgi:alkylmercury lyase
VVQLLVQGQPVSPLHLAWALLRAADEVRAEQSMHPEIEYDANGNIVGSGLTLVPTAYQVAQLVVAYQATNGE